MKVILLGLLLCIALCNGCSTKKKIECTAAYVGCGTVCGCDVPVCECCVACLACITATTADCCECLFPGWSGCNDKILLNKTEIISQSYNNNSKFYASDLSYTNVTLDKLLLWNEVNGKMDHCRKCMWQDKLYNCGTCIIYGESFHMTCCYNAWLLGDCMSCPWK